MFTGSFIGRCGKDAVVKQNNNGDYVAIDVAEDYFSRNEKKTRWWRVYCMTQKAVKLAQYFTKGRQLQFVGEFSNVDIYEEKKTGKPTYQLVMFAYRVEFINSGKKKELQNADNAENRGETQPAPVSEAERKATPAMPFTASTEEKDDLPF